jgi:hypothetical protein
MPAHDDQDQPTLLDDAGRPADPSSTTPPEPWSDTLLSDTDLLGPPRGTEGNHDAHLIELLEALLDDGHDPAELGAALWRRVPPPPIESMDWRATRRWLDGALWAAPTYDDMVDLRRATRNVLEYRWRAGRWVDDLRRTVEAKRAELAARDAGTYWRNRDARRSATRPMHIDVGDETWSAFKRDVVSHGETIGAALGRLVSEAVVAGDLPAALTTSVGRRGQSGAGRRAGRFARATVDDETWIAFRALACEAGTSVARAVGMLVNRASRST